MGQRKIVFQSMNFITDTHPFFWSLFSVHRLSPCVRQIFEDAGHGAHTLYIPTVVVTELMLVVEHTCPTTKYFEVLEMLRTLQSAGNYLFLPLMPETVIGSYIFNDAMSNMFDRLIIAESRRLRAPLITCDPVISASGLVDVVWD